MDLTFKTKTLQWKLKVLPLPDRTGYTGYTWVYRVYTIYMGIKGKQGVRGYTGYTGFLTIIPRARMGSESIAHEAIVLIFKAGAFRYWWAITYSLVVAQPVRTQD